jgi:hypothetical protein
MVDDPADSPGPTPERLARAEEFFTEVGRSKSAKRFTMLDDELGRAWMRKYVTAEEYSALRKYALHWLAGGLQGQLASVDLNRILAFDPGAMSGLAKTERQAEHRRLYWQARTEIGTRPAYVADHVACFDTKVPAVALALGYRSRYSGREKVKELLAEAGYRLVRFWADSARR